MLTKFPNIFLTLMLCCNFLNANESDKSFWEESSFETDYCNISCPGHVPHTLCPTLDVKPCKEIDLITFSKHSDTEPLMRLIVNGHNGLRNRIAEKMKVRNMLEMTWDNKLAMMAANYLKYCPERTLDPCTTFSNTVKEEDTLAGFYKGNHSYPQIVQNNYREKAVYYPYKFIERVMRTWYFEKEGMREPMEFVKDTIIYGRLRGENNFTHFASPFTFRFGCAMASYAGHYHLVCNYYPYFRTSTNVVFFYRGTPVSNCPARFPMADDSYKNLCTADTGNYFDDSSKNLNFDMNLLYFLFLYYMAVYLC